RATRSTASTTGSASQFAGRPRSTSTWRRSTAPGKRSSASPNSPPNPSSGRRRCMTSPTISSRPIAETMKVSKSMRVLVAFGTRPEIIKLGPVCRALQEAGAELDVFWSGQHVELAAGLLDFFGIGVTHNGANIVEEQGLAGKFGRMTEQVEKILRAKTYDWI